MWLTSQAQNLSFVLEDKHKIKFEDRSIPELKDPHDVLVNPSFTGICGSDIHYWEDGRIGDFVLQGPMVLGHESSGVIVKTGSAVKGLKPGDRVAIEPGTPCYHCVRCKSGSYHLCPDMKFASTPPYDGTLCKYWVLSGDLCYKIAPHVELDEAALTEPTAVAVHVVRLADVRPGHRVIVFGAGPVGLLCAGVSKGYGATEVVLVDLQEKRLDFAKSWVSGGCQTFVPAKVSASENAAKLREQLGWDDGADIVLEATGAEPCIQQGMAMCRMGATFVQVGMGKPSIDFPLLTACMREIKVQGSFRYKEGDFKIALDLIERGIVDAKKLISGRVKFEDAEGAFQDAKAGKGIKFLIEGVKA